MPGIKTLPLPQLDARLLGARRIPAFIDPILAESSGVRIAFTGREGGTSEPPYDSLNLGSHVNDDLSLVQANRALVADALGVARERVVVPNQVHGVEGVCVLSAEDTAIEEVRRAAQAGADYVLVGVSDVAALLCFADCLPLIIVSPTGRFAVVHAGWRGAVAGIAGAAARRLAQEDELQLGVQAPSCYNAYIGPHIHSECFECGPEVVTKFVDAFGAQVIDSNGNISLAAAVSADLMRAGVDSGRIADAGACTHCAADRFFSYRATGGVCGRQGAMAVRVQEGGSAPWE